MSPCQRKLVESYRVRKEEYIYIYKTNIIFESQHVRNELFYFNSQSFTRVQNVLIPPGRRSHQRDPNRRRSRAQSVQMSVTLSPPSYEESMRTTPMGFFNMVS